MPVRWRRRPAAVSAAVAAGADPDFSCAGELEPADRPAIRGKCALGWVCRPPLWVWWSSLVGGSISLIGLCLLGSSLRAGALDFIVDSKQDFLFLGASSCLFVLQVPPPGFVMCPGLVPSGGSIPPPGFGFGCCCCSRATCNRPCLLCVRLWFTRRTAAARSALCAVFGVCGCGAF